MSENKQTGIPGPEDFLKYRKNSLSASEKNTFERELQKDPFAAEAEEGFSSVDPEYLEEDLQRLGRRLQKRINVRSRLMVYRIAASLAIIIGIASVIIISERNRKIPMTGKPQEELIIAEAEPLKKQTGQHIKEDFSKEVNAGKTETDAAKPDKSLETEQIKAGAIEAFADTLAAYPADDKPALKNIIAREAEVTAEAAAAHVTEKSKIQQDARNEVAIPTGGAPVEARADTEKKSVDYSSPVPATGKEAFSNYIKENIRLPEGPVKDEKLAVELSFVVKTDGRPDKFRILNSPGKKYSDEAIRLVKEGPGWIPARREDKTVADTVHLTIEFYPSAGISYTGTGNH